MFPDFKETGGGVCNSCGKFHDGFALLQWINGWSFPEALEEVASKLGVSRDSNRTPIAPRNPEVATPAKPAMGPVNNAALTLSLKQVWLGTLSIKHPKAEPARLYLASRRIAIRAVPETVRFHPGLSYFDVESGKKLGLFPCLVVKYVGKGQAITIHRTYLSGEGTKAPVPEPKKMMMYPKGDRQLVGSAMRLDQASPILCVGEGLETMLTVRQVTRLPTWATGTSGLLSMLDVPPITRLMLIFADKDRTGVGLDAAKALHQRAWMQGVQCQIHIPSIDLIEGVKGVDWNDVFVRAGESAFPDLKKYLATGT